MKEMPTTVHLVDSQERVNLLHQDGLYQNTDDTADELYLETLLLADFSLPVST